MHSDKVVVFGKAVVFGQSGCIRAKMFSNRAIWLLSGKFVVFGQGGCTQAKLVVIGQNDL